MKQSDYLSFNVYCAMLPPTRDPMNGSIPRKASHNAPIVDIRPRLQCQWEMLRPRFTDVIKNT